MGELILYKNEKKIMSPFCEISFTLENGATIEDLIESLEYWGVEYKDMDKEYVGAMGTFDKKRRELVD